MLHTHECIAKHGVRGQGRKPLETEDFPLYKFQEKITKHNLT